MKHPRIFFTAASSLLLASGTARAASFQSFEGDGFGDWQTTGDAFGLSPVHGGKMEGLNAEISGFSNDAYAASAHGGDAATGTLTSPEFTISQPYIAFLIAGGKHPGKTAAQLMIDGKVVMETTGNNSVELAPASWDVARYKGKKAVIRIIDDEKGGWGVILVDEFTMSDKADAALPGSTANGKAVPKSVTTENLPGATIPEGSSLKIEADFKGQQLKSPTALTFDEQGNIYISETHRFRYGVEDDRNHLAWYLDDLASMKPEDRRALHEKWTKEKSIADMTAKSEVIRRLADTNGDGTLDESKVFADGFNDVLDGTAAGVFYYDGALYFACIPKIYKLRDTDGDGVSDERKVVEEGFGIRVSLSGHDLNGFTLGPDGRIYGTIGDLGISMVTKEGVSYQYPNEGAFFRFEPDGTGFELIHTGLRNPKEVSFDEFGNAITVDNNSDQGDGSRIVYLVEGGESGWQMEHQAMHTFHRQIGLEERPTSRWMNEKMWEMQNEIQPAYILPPSANLTAGPSGLTYHPGAGFLESEKGRFLICDYKGGPAASGIWSFAMANEGGGMKMTDARQFSWGIAATDVEYSFDGRIFVADFVTGWESHDNGRLVSISANGEMYKAKEAAEAAKLISEGFDQRTSAELGALLSHADSRVRIRAQVALTRKADAIAVFQKAVASADQITRIHGVWGLGIVARRGSVPSPTGEFTTIPRKGIREQAAAALVPLLKDPDPEIRVQALRVIGDAPLAGDSLPLGSLLEDDSLRVRFAAGIAIGKMKAMGQYSAILDFLRKNNNRDRYLRHAGIYALQHIVKDASQVSALTSDSSSAVRLAAVVVLRRMNSTEVARFINDPDPTVQDEAVRAVYDKDMNDMRPLAAALLDDLGKRKWTDFMLRRLVHNAFRVGGPENAARLLKVVADSTLPDETRKEALRLIGLWEKPFPADQLIGHWRPLPERPLDTLKPALIAALPGLLKNDGFVLTGALDLIEKFKIDIASLDDATLSSLVNNTTLPAGARAKALELSIERGGKGLEEFLVKLSTDKTDAVAIAALEGLAKLDPKAAIAPLEAAISSGSASRGQKAWGVIAAIPGDEAASFIAEKLKALSVAKGVSPSAIELLAAAKSRKEPVVASALASYEKAITADKDPLAKFNIALEGGNPENGASLFASHPGGQCLRCHKADNDAHSAGGDAGPNLAGIAKLRDSKYFLESMINPGAIITPGFGITAVTFKNGGSIAGNLVAENDDHIDIATPEKLLRAKRADIASFTPPVSPMPPMESLLKPEEIRDLIAWLASLDKEGPKPAERKAELVDPAKLPGAK